MVERPRPLASECVAQLRRRGRRLWRSRSRCSHRRSHASRELEYYVKCRMSAMPAAGDREAHRSPKEADHVSHCTPSNQLLRTVATPRPNLVRLRDHSSNIVRAQQRRSGPSDRGDIAIWSGGAILATRSVHQQRHGPRSGSPGSSALANRERRGSMEQESLPAANRRAHGRFGCSGRRDRGNIVLGELPHFQWAELLIFARVRLRRHHARQGEIRYGGLDEMSPVAISTCRAPWWSR